MNREAMIAEIINCARKPLPQIVERMELEGTDGKWYFAGGFLSRVDSTGETRSAGFCVLSSEGTTIGQRYDSKQFIIDRHNKRQAAQMQELQEHYETQPIEALQDSLTFWQKQAS